jgi:hypothetical protein
MVNDARSHFLFRGCARGGRGARAMGRGRARIGGGLGVSDGLFQLFEQGDLGGIDHLPGMGQREPTSFIDLGEFLLPAGAAGPFEFEGITGDGSGVEVAGEGPGKNTFASFLADRTQWLKMSLESETGLFAEFAEGGIERRLFIFELSFGDGPAARLLIFPEGAAGMDEKYFKCAGGPTVEEDAGRLLSGHADTGVC